MFGKKTTINLLCIFHKVLLMVLKSSLVLVKGCSEVVMLQIMKPILFNIFLWIFSDQLSVASSLAAYKSIQSLSVPMDQTDAGLQLIRNSALKETNFENGISFCLRIFYQRLSRSSALFTFGKDDFGKQIKASMVNDGLITFGDHQFRILDAEMKTFLVWAPQRWHHFCMTFNRSNSQVSIVKVNSCLEYKTNFRN